MAKKGYRFYPIFICLIISLLYCFKIPLTTNAADTAGDIYFNSGVQKYLKADLDGAIKDLENVLSFDKANPKAKAFLVKVLVEKGTEFYLRKDYPSALPYLKRAHEIVPENEKVTSMFNLADNEVNPKPVAVAPLPSTIGGPSKDIVMAPGATAPTAATAIPATEPEKYDMMVNLFSTFQKQQEKILEAYIGPQQIIKDMISVSDKERLELYQSMSNERAKYFEMLSKKDETVVGAFKETQNIMRKTMIYYIVGFVVAIIGIIFFIYMVLNYVSARREAALLQYQERILGMMQEQNVALAQGQARLMLGSSASTEGKGTISAREMIEDSNPHVRARGVEVIEAELVKEMDPEVAIKLLTPFLKDPDNRVRANAAKALYDFDKPRALDSLNEMAENEDKWMRVSAAWAFGEIGTTDVIDPLLKLSDDSEYHVKRRAIKALSTILQNKKDLLSAEMQNKILQALEKERKEGWIV